LPADWLLAADWSDCGMLEVELPVWPLTDPLWLLLAAGKFELWPFGTSEEAVCPAALPA